MRRFSLLLGIIFLVNIPAQENVSLDWDIESVFDVPAEDTGESPIGTPFPGKSINDENENTVLQRINRNSLIFDLSYGFIAGIYPGWAESPWDSGDNNTFSWNPGAKLSSSFGMDARISNVFRVISNINFTVPEEGGFKFNLGDFFFDYNLFDVVFFRGGKYNLKWGISPNFGFTNLLARVPDDINFTFDSFILKADIPVGVGGFQFLALTRADLTGGNLLDSEKVGVGGKYNLALRKADIDMGVYYQHRMPVRGFISLKTTVVNTEVYSEGLAAYDYGGIPTFTGAFNFGFTHEFFNKKLAVNGEFFFNNEGNSFFYTSRTDFLKAKASPFIDGSNIALNFRYNIGGIGNPRFYLQALYAINKNSARVVPALRLSPFSHIEIYLAFPMDIGSKDGYYYKNPMIQDRDGNPLRFAAVFLVSLSGNLRFTVY
jgi:hypothetical protein